MDAKEVAKRVGTVEITPMATPKSFFAKVPKSALGPELEKYYNDMKPALENLQVKGFRKGKIPKEMLIKKMGGRDAFYEPLLAKIMKEIAVAQGREICSWSHLFLNEKDDNFILSSVVFEFPEATLPKKLSFLSEVKMESVDQEQVEQGVETEVDRVKAVYTTYQDILTPAEIGDRVTAICSAFCGKKTVDEYVGEYKIILSERSIAWWDAYVQGQTSGYETTVTFIETKESSPYFDQEITARIKLKSVQKVHVPEVNDRILEAVQYKTEEAWRTDLIRRYAEMMESNIKQKALKKCLDLLIKNAAIEPIPLSWIQMQVETKLNQLCEQVSEQQAYQMYGVSNVEQLRELLRMQVYIDVKDDLILRVIASRNKISREEETWQEQTFEKILELTNKEESK